MPALLKRAAFAFGALAVLFNLNVTPAKAADIPVDMNIDLDGLVVSKSEFVCLALNDYWESRGEPLAGRMAVAQVVLNRAMDPRYPTNICDVVKQDHSRGGRACQFSWWCDGKSDIPHEKDAWRRSVRLASAVLTRDNNIQDNTDGALWYHATTVNPKWAGDLVKATRIGDHIFYREADRVEELQASLSPGEGYFFGLIRAWLEPKPQSKFVRWVDSRRERFSMVQN